MPFVVRRHPTSRDFRARAGAWLLAREPEHTLVLGILGQLDSGDHDYGEPVYLATIEEEDVVVGCAFRTPPHKLGVTRMPLEAVDELIVDVGEVFAHIPAVLGPEAVALAVAREWCARKGGTPRITMGMRIHALDAVEAPDPLPSGRFRIAESDDMGILEDWHSGFERETHVALTSSPDRLRRRIADGMIGVWDDEGLRSMVAAVAPSHHGIRIGGVYTPPAFRGRGYGSAVVSSMSQLSLDRGHHFCVLYTDLENPTSNKIYRALGYRPVSDVVDVSVTELDR